PPDGIHGNRGSPDAGGKSGTVRGFPGSGCGGPDGGTRPLETDPRSLSSSRRGAAPLTSRSPAPHRLSRFQSPPGSEGKAVRRACGVLHQSPGVGLEKVSGADHRPKRREDVGYSALRGGHLPPRGGPGGIRGAPAPGYSPGSHGKEQGAPRPWSGSPAENR